MVQVRVKPRVRMAARAPERNASADLDFQEIPAKKVFSSVYPGVHLPGYVAGVALATPVLVELLRQKL